MFHHPRVDVFYRPQMVPPVSRSFSQSPTKPRRFVEYLLKCEAFADHVRIREDFRRVQTDELLTAHEDDYINAYLLGTEPLASSSGISWSPEQRRAVLTTNGSLLAAVRAALEHPETLALSPSSGFHHATPNEGHGFCTFSGQVIAALDVWAKQGKRGAWIDLDQHEGNSIDDSRMFAPALNEAIPEGCNLNPAGSHATYLRSLSQMLRGLGERVVAGEIDYVCVAHGADSHEWDDLGGRVTTDEWVMASSMVYESIRSWSVQLGRPVPVVMALFGGYRDDDPSSVLGLHAMDLAQAIHWLADDVELGQFRAEVRASTAPVWR